MLRKTIILFFCVFSLFLISCLEVVKGINDWTNIDNIETIEVKSHILSDDAIKVILPSTFKRYSSIDYLALLDSLIIDNRELEIERTRFRFMREMKGNHYIFFDEVFSSTYTVNSVPYTPFNRQDAQYLLGMIRQNQKLIANQTDMKYEKITAKFNDNGKTQIFKSIFKLENTKTNNFAFQHAFIISSNQKTVFINLIAPFEANFDPFLEKMIL